MGDETSESRKAIGLFWDIENCHVPRNVSPLSVVKRLREKFFAGLREAEFMCVCDINKESTAVIEELNNGQVNIVHINATSKNTADDKIKQSLRRFADTHPAETKIVLISGDVNFCAELSDLRHRKHFYIILIHKRQVHEALTQCAHEHYVYEDLMGDLPRKPESKVNIQNNTLALVQSLRLVARGFPNEIPLDLVKKRLKTLASNCGGKVIQINHDKATLVFPTQEASLRAKRRMADADVYGLPITVNACRVDDHTHSPTRFTNYSAGRSRSESRDRQQHSDAPGAPGNSSPIKKFGSQHGAFGSGYKSIQNSYSSVAENICITQSYQASRPFQGAEEGGEREVYSSVKEMTADYSQPSPMHPMGILRHQNYPEHLDSQTGLSSESQLHLQPPNLSEPPPAFNAFPVSGADGGTLNVSKTYNVTYQHHYIPPGMVTPQPVYPYQNNFKPPAYNPGPRQAVKFSYDFNRPLSRNAISTGSFNTQPQVRPHSSRSVSSTSDMFDDEDEDGLEMAYFKAQQLGEGEKSAPVDLTVTNLDYNISKKEWRKILAATFQPHVKVLGICMRTQPDNTSIASIKVPCVEDARFAISQVHRRKIGYKRIHVALSEEKDQAPAESTRQETISILSDAKGLTMPVFKFIENYEKRYHKSVSVSDLYKMKEVVEIMDRGGAGRMVKLARGVCPTPSPTPDSFTDPFQEENMDQPVCLFHCPEGSHQHAEAMSLGMLPNVKLQRKPFAAQVHSLLLGHNGVMPLMSFPMCYKAQFSSILSSVEEGVYMEHLISCVPGVEIVMSKKGVKVIHFQEKKDPPGAEAICGRTTPVMSQQMALLSREIGDLLRQSRLCSIPASKFIPAYHHHFGRQCRVADYGYTKLAELFEALPHVLQVLGTGDRKVLTLSHRAQVKRFIADVLKVLKTQPGKLLSVTDLPATYERMLFRKFDISHYGVSFIEDMFMDIPPTSILVTAERYPRKIVLAIPKRDQTPEEVKRTEQFALELIDLLKHNPHGRMTFNKFIPAYHHHFGRQCRVADYGFTRLTDLFESVSHVVEIVDDEEERMIKLTAPEMRMVLAEQITGLLRESPGMTLPLDQVLLTFQRQYGFPLRLSDFGVCDVKDLLAKIKYCVYVDTKEKPPIVKLRPTPEMPALAVNVIRLLMDQSGGCLPLVELCSRYRQTFAVDCNVQEIMDNLADYVQISTEGDDGSALIRLTALQILGKDIRAMLRKVGSVPFVKVGQIYQEQYFVELKPALYGFPDVSSLLRSLYHIVKIVGRTGRKFVELSPILGDGNEDEEMVQLNRVSSVSRYDDPLSAPVPSGVPSPSLMPKQNFVTPDLMDFNSADYLDMFDLSAEEKKGLRTPLCRTPTTMLQSEFNSGPSPTPLQPSPDVFPGDVPLTSPFPPPPSFPVDMPPPNFARGLQPPEQPLPPLSSSAPDTNRPAFPFNSAPPPAQDSTGALTPASLQWKERLEGGSVSFTPEQLNNLKSMGLLKREGTEGGLTVTDSKARPVSAPTYETSGNGQQQTLPGSAAVTKPAPEGAMPGLSVNGSVTMMTESAEAAVTFADPCIIQSSLSVAPGFSSQPLFKMPQFGNGQFMEFKVPAIGGYKVPGLPASWDISAGEKDVSKQSSEETANSLVKALKASLNLSEDGEGDITQAAPTCTMSSLHPSLQGTSMAAALGMVLKDTSSSSVDNDASPAAPVNHSVSLLEKSSQLHQLVLTQAGNASSLATASTLHGRDATAAGVGSADSGSSAPIPANDSFSLDQPLDTSSTRSARSESKGSQGSVSDTTSSSPSPRKNPRRAKIAAKFMNPGSGQ